MDNYEATKMVMTKIQALDPENASKIMGYILIQDLGEKEMIRLALGPDSLLVSLMNQAKSCLGLASPNAAKTPPFATNRPNPFAQSSPRILIPNSNGFHHQNHHLNSPNPSSPSPTSPWSNAAAFSRNSPRPAPGPATYAAVVNGGGSNTNNASGSSSSSISLPFYPVNSTTNNNTSSDLSDEFVVGNLQVQDQLSFLDESLDHHNHHPLMSPSGRSDSMLFPYGNCEDPTSTTTTTNHQMVHRRSCSVNDAFLLGGGGNGVEDGGGAGGFGWRPCMYFARGFCKNGSSCKFLHGGGGGGYDSPDGSVGSPSKIDGGGGFDEFLRIKAIQQQRLAAASQLISSGAQHPFTYNNKGLSFFNENQRSAAAVLMMGEEFHKFGRFRPDRSNFSSMGLDTSANSSSRQIYLTFPADSTFKEEDVSNYFSMYGPVQDVRIPYQQKRMFGFVTFVYPETVKLILAKGNPHFVCDSRVLVKPYKEKGKVADKKHQQQQQHLMDRGEFSPCLSPSGFDSREPYDLPFGAGMFYNMQEMMLRRKFEEQAIDLQGRRLMSMQLMDLKNHHNNPQFQPSLSPTGSIPSPCQINQNLVLVSDDSNAEVEEEISASREAPHSPTVVNNGKATPEATESSDDNNGSESGNKVENANVKDSDLHESLEHILPDNLFASPTKAVAEHHSLFSGASTETVDSTPSTNTHSKSTPALPSTSTLGMLTPPKLCNFQMPRFSSGQEATIEM